MNTSPLYRAVIAVIGVSLLGFAPSRSAETIVAIDNAVIVANVPRLGVNLGFRTSWGAEQLMSNLIMNPGFEGIVDRSLITAQSAGANGFGNTDASVASHDGFWNDAAFEIRTGPSAGATGSVVNYARIGPGAQREFATRETLPVLAPGDKISVTKYLDTDLPTQWWFSEADRGRAVPSSKIRPGSPGIRSLELLPSPASPVSVRSYLDAIGPRAGAMLPVVGDWQLSYWVRCHGAAQLDVSFRRLDAKVFVKKSEACFDAWKKLTVDFRSQEDHGTGTLELEFRASGEGEVFLDDVNLGRHEQPAFPFRREVVDALAQLHPSYLRDWQGQLGDTLENRLANQFGRRAWRYRPGGNDASDFGYSLPEFLDLCRHVHANPWIVAPPTFTDQEWFRLGQFLARREKNDHFTELLVEFGNENWNPVFAAGGITDPKTHAEAADRAFGKLTEGAGATRILRVMNAHYANPLPGLDALQGSHFVDVFAVAPYFFFEVPRGPWPNEVPAALFTNESARLRTIVKGSSGLHRELAFYEINLHSTGGDARGEERASAVAGMASASALAIPILRALAQGVRRQCIYTLSGFDAQVNGSSSRVPLWGITRDLGPTRRFRPTGLALVLLNRALGGDLHAHHAGDPALSIAPLSSARGWSVVVASSSPQPKDVILQFPDGSLLAMPHRLQTVRAAGPLMTNEVKENVYIEESVLTHEGNRIHLQVPPFGLVVLLPGVADHE